MPCCRFLFLVPHVLVSFIACPLLLTGFCSIATLSAPSPQERDPYLSGGYAALQALLADWFLAVETGAEYASPPRAHASFAADSIGFAAFPTVRHVQDTFKTFVGLQFQILHVLAYLWPFSRLVRALVEEKEEGTRALLELLGVPASTLWCSWALLYALQARARRSAVGGRGSGIGGRVGVQRDDAGRAKALGTTHQ